MDALATAEIRELTLDDELNSIAGGSPTYFLSFGIANMYINVASEGTTGGVWVCDAGGCYAGPFGR